MVNQPSTLHAFQSALLGFLRQNGDARASAIALAEALSRFARQRPRGEAEFWNTAARFYSDLATACAQPDAAQRLWSIRLERQMRRCLKGADLDPALARELSSLRPPLPGPATPNGAALPPELSALAGLLGRTLDADALAAWNTAGANLHRAWNGGNRPDGPVLRQGAAALCAAATRLAPDQPDCLALAVALADAVDSLEVQPETGAETRATMAATLEALAEADAPTRPGFADRVAHLANRLEAITNAANARRSTGAGPVGPQPPFGSRSIAAEFAAEMAERVSELREALFCYPPDRDGLALGAAELAEETAGHGLAAVAEIASLFSRAVDFGTPDLESATVRARLESALDALSAQLDEVGDDRWPSPQPRLAATLAAFVGECPR